MRKLIMQQWMTLDGFVADPAGGLDFFSELGTDDNKYSDEDQLTMLRDRIDLILLGRNTYKIFVDFWPTDASRHEIITEQLNSTPKVIFSDTLTKATWGTWPDAEVASGNASEHVRRLKSLPGKDMILWGSISLCQLLMKDDLIDEYHIQVVPSLLGAGLKLFRDDGIPRKLKLQSSKQYPTGMVFLKYERA